MIQLEKAKFEPKTNFTYGRFYCADNNNLTLEIFRTVQLQIRRQGYRLPDERRLRLCWEGYSESKLLRLII